MTVMQITAQGARPVDLSSRAMLAQLSIRQWTGRKLDKAVTDATNAQHGAKSDAGRYNKSLIAKDRLAKIAQIVGKARAQHVYISLPWLQDGARIMPADAFPRYTAVMRELREEFETEVASFVADYPLYVSEAQDRLGSMFRQADYPQPEQIAGKFSWDVNVLPLPSADDFRVNLGDAATARIKAEIEQTMTEALNQAMGDAWTRLHGVVKAMADKLAAYKPATDVTKASGVFRDSLVENVRELVDVLPLLNVTGDAALAKLTEAARDKLTAHDAKALRDDDAARAEVQAAAAQIADDLAAFMGG